MHLHFNKLLAVTTFSILLLSGCAAQRGSSQGGETVAIDNRPCMKNFSMKGSYWSGRTVKSFQTYPTGSKTPVFNYLKRKLSSIGYKINSSDKSAGIISTSFEVGFGKGATTNTNAIVTRHKPKGVKVDLTFIAAGGISFGLGSAQEEFCSILEGVPN